MSDIDKMFIGSRRRLLSDDFNNGERLRDRALLEAISAISLGDFYKLTADGIGGVIGGLTVRAIIGTNEIEVQPGIALVAETPVTATYDPPVNWIELGVPYRLDLDSFVDGGNPRLVTIEIEPDLVSKVNEPVDVFDPGTGTFGVANQDIVIGSSPIISANVGAAAASPVVAAGPGTNGKIPLAVVKLAAGQVNFTDPFVSVLMCRPLLLGGGANVLIPPRSVSGAGFSVGEFGGASILSTNIADMHDCVIEMNGLVARGRGQAEFVGANVRTISGITTADLLTTVQAVYGYAAPPPWASDYGDIAPREARVENPNNVNLFLTPESVVLGNGSTFTSLAYSNPSVTGPGLENMIVFFDVTAPAGLSNAPSSSGGPRIDDLRAPHPTTDGGALITLDATQDPSWGATQEVADSVYLGCVSSLGTGGRLMAQSYRGRGFVRAVDEVDFGGTSYRPVVSYSANTGILDPIYPGHYPDMSNAGHLEILPLFATRVEISGVLTNTGAAGAARMQFGSEHGFGGAQQAPSLVGFYTARYEGADLPNTSSFGAEVIPIERNNSGRASVYAQVGGVGGTVAVVLTGYEDPILASR